jgi:hypothetical protein
VIGTQFKDSAESKKLIEIFSDPRLEEYLHTTEDPLVKDVLTPVSTE